MLDIGAYIGEYTYILEKHMDPSLIYTCEPHRELYERLTRLFPKVTVSNCALSSGPGSAKMKIPFIGDELMGSRATLEDFVEDNETRDITVNVEKIDLDGFVRAKNIRDIGFIKIDVEGHEPEPR